MRYNLITTFLESSVSKKIIFIWVNGVIVLIKKKFLNQILKTQCLIIGQITKR